jgi:hypothetical protein
MCEQLLMCAATPSHRSPRRTSASHDFFSSRHRGSRANANSDDDDEDCGGGGGEFKPASAAPDATASMELAGRHASSETKDGAVVVAAAGDTAFGHVDGHETESARIFWTMNPETRICQLAPDFARHSGHEIDFFWRTHAVMHAAQPRWPHSRSTGRSGTSLHTGHARSRTVAM